MPVAVRTFLIGAFRCHAIDDGISTYTTASFLFASASKGEREVALREAGEDPKALRCSNTCLLIETQEERILIDTGSGALSKTRSGRENLGRLFAGLDSLNVGAGDVDLVVLTHLHSDHVWGCFGPLGREPVFSSATHIISHPEWDGAHPSLAKDLSRLRPQVELVEPDASVASGIKLLPAPGHSAGHCAVHIESDGEDLLCIGDVVVHRLNLEQPEWTMSHEEAPQVAVASRRRLLDRAAETSALVHAFHMPFPSLGHISTDGKSYAWIPVDEDPTQKEET